MANTLKFGNGNWATKEGSLLAYNSENNNFKPLPFDFTRASTATYVDSDGLIKTAGIGEPRIDYTDNTDGALLLEPARTNLSLYSHQFNLWSGGLVTADQAISPDGNLTADEITKTSAFSAQSRTETGTSGVNYVFSLFVKPKTTNRITLRQASGSNDVRRYFDLSDQSSGQSGGNQLGFVSEGIEEYSNGWYRIYTVCTSNGTAINTNIYSGMAGNTTYDGEFYIWGAQLEVGSATSYIPTSGSAVTRVVDDIALTFPDADSYTSSNGFSIISKFDIGAAGTGTSTPFLLFHDDTSSTYIGFGSNDSSFRCRLNLSGTAYLNTQPNASRTQKNSLFVSCDSSGWSQGANGTTNHTGVNDASVFNKLSTISFNPSEIYGIIKITELIVYNTRLTNAELETLTT